VTSDLDLLRIDLETSFVLSAPSRLERLNAPDETAALIRDEIYALSGEGSGREKKPAKRSKKNKTA